MTPEAVLLDSDVFRQFVESNSTPQLRRFRAELGIQLGIVEEVELELRRRPDYIDAAVVKALSSGALQLFDADLIRKHLFKSSPDTPVAMATVAQIMEKGEELNRYVDPGEAYTFAVASELSIPAASNDGRAIDTLRRVGLPVPSPVLRFFDLLVVLYQSKILAADECDKIKGRLLGAGEWVPREFKGQTFEIGLKAFTPRLVNGDHPACGRQIETRAGHDRVLMFKKST